mmetsp:Transcript_11433/g.11458  ORF Transcript_11433/g.11458 Transcript_11433/m.11458 type:complete len:162 (+) Transcript_11433:243-728(+)
MFRVSESRNGKIPRESCGNIYLQVFANLNDEIRPITVEVDSNEYISTVKKMVLEEIQETLIIDVDNYRLIYKGLELQNSSILSDYGIKDWEVLDFYLKSKKVESQISRTLSNFSLFLDDSDSFWWSPLFKCILHNICINDDGMDDSTRHRHQGEHRASGTV